MYRKPVVFTAVDAETDEPITDFEVWAKAEFLGKTTASSATSGKVYVVSISPNRTGAHVVAEGYKMTPVKLTYPYENMVVRMQRGGRVVKGRVVDPNGKPIPDVLDQTGLYSQYRPTATTDTDGRFRILGIPEDKDQLYPVLRAEGFIPKGSFAAKLTGDVSEWSLTLDPAATVRGKVVDLQGQPIANVRLVSGRDRHASNSANGEAETDAEGRFELSNVPPGSAPLTFISKNHAPKAEIVNAKLGEVTDFQITLEPGKPVTGRITDPAGSPLEGVWLIVDTWDGLRVFDRQTHTAADGTFTLPHMPATDSEVHVLEKGYVSKRDLMVSGGDEVDIILKPVVEHVIRVRAADTAIIPQKLAVLVGYQWDGRDSISWDSNSHRTQRSFKAATGTLTLSDSEPINGRLFYKFTAPGYSSIEIEQPDDAKGSQTIDLKMQPADSVPFKVVMQTGANDSQPVKDAVLLVLPAAGNVPWWQSHGDRPERDDLIDDGLPIATTDSQGIAKLNRNDVQSGDTFLIYHESTGFHQIERPIASPRQRVIRTRRWSFPSAGRARYVARLSMTANLFQVKKYRSATRPKLGIITILALPST